jgi:hypothetical protein
MFTFLVEVDSILAPRMQISDEIELLAGPRMKGMGDLETSAQFVRISRSWRLKPRPTANRSWEPFGVNAWTISFRSTIATCGLS